MLKNKQQWVNKEMSDYLQDKKTNKYQSESEPQTHKKLFSQNLFEYDTFLKIN